MDIDQSCPHVMITHVLCAHRPPMCVSTDIYVWVSEYSLFLLNLRT